MQRIPRAQKNDSTTPCKEVSHIHRHVVKGWTTNPNNSDESYLGTRAKTDSHEEEESENSNMSDEDVSGHYRLVIVKTPNTGKTSFRNRFKVFY